MDLEHFVASDQLSNRFVNCVVQFDELLALVVFLFEDGFLVAVRFQILFHVEKQFEQQLADTQIFADVLLHFEWMDVLEIRLFRGTIF